MTELNQPEEPKPEVTNAQIAERTDVSFVQEAQFEWQRVQSELKKYLEHYQGRLAALDGEINGMRKEVSEDAKPLRNSIEMNRFISKAFALVMKYDNLTELHVEAVKIFEQEYLRLGEIVSKSVEARDALRDEVSELQEKFGVLMVLLRPWLAELPSGGGNKHGMDILIAGARKLVEEMSKSQSAKEAEATFKLQFYQDEISKRDKTIERLEAKLEKSVPIESMQNFAELFRTTTTKTAPTESRLLSDKVRLPTAAEKIGGVVARL